MGNFETALRHLAAAQTPRLRGSSLQLSSCVVAEPPQTKRRFGDKLQELEIGNLPN